MKPSPEEGLKYKGENEKKKKKESKKKKKKRKEKQMQISFESDLEDHVYLHKIFFTYTEVARILTRKTYFR